MAFNGNANATQLVLSILRGETNISGYSIDDWGLAYTFLRKHKVALQVFKTPPDSMPFPFLKLHKDYLLRAKSIIDMQLSTLVSFSNAARKEALQFVVVKGIATSYWAYGDVYSRLSSDIDILVDFEDSPKADYVIKKVGLWQPAEIYKYWEALKNGQGATNVTYPAPFLVSHKKDSVHYSPYVTKHSRSPVVLELHHSLHGFPLGLLSEVVNNPAFLLFDSEAIPVSDYRHSLLITALNAYENAESRFYNQSGDALGLASLYDINIMLQNEKNAENLKALQSCLGKAKFAQVLSDLYELFPKSPLFSKGNYDLRSDTPDTQYLKRLFWPEYKWAKARQMERASALRNSIASNGSFLLPMGIKCKLELGTSARFACAIPSQLTRVYDDYIIQLVLYCMSGCYIQRRINIFTWHSKWVYSDEHSTRVSENGAAFKKEEHTECEMSLAGGEELVSLSLETDASELITENGVVIVEISLFHRHINNIFHRVGKKSDKYMIAHNAGDTEDEVLFGC